MEASKAHRTPTPPEQPDPYRRVLSWVRIDFPPDHADPSLVSWMMAVCVSVVGSLVADALLVAIGTHIFPSTHGYVHFRFSDYGKLTVVGVVIACLAWPVVTRISSSPRWLFVRLAIAVTLVLWLPDLWILRQGQPAKAVAILMVMHVAIAVVTYGTLVVVARPARRRWRDDNAGTTI